MQGVRQSTGIAGEEMQPSARSSGVMGSTASPERLQRWSRFLLLSALATSSAASTG
jgi:hypothetical protein